MPKQRIALIIGVILSLMAIFMVKVYLDQQRYVVQEQAKKALAQIQANQTAVLVAKVDIPRGTMVEPDSLQVAIVPNQFVQPQAVTSLDRIAGMMTIAPISKGEQVSISKLTYPRQIRGLAEATPVGKRAITIAVDNVSSVGGMIKAGDYVDVIAMIPVPVQTPDGRQSSQVTAIPLFQNVLVLAVGQETAALPKEEAGRYRKEEKKEISPLITLSLNPQEVNLIAFVQEQGKIRLVLRSPSDSQIGQVGPTSWDTLFQYVMPQEVTRPEPKVKDEAPSDVVFVEIYRGLNKEKVPIPK